MLLFARIVRFRRAQRRPSSQRFVLVSPLVLLAAIAWVVSGELVGLLLGAHARAIPRERHTRSRFMTAASAARSRSWVEGYNESPGARLGRRTRWRRCCGRDFALGEVSR